MGHGKKAKYSLWRRESEKKAVHTCQHSGHLNFTVSVYGVSEFHSCVREQDMATATLAHSFSDDTDAGDKLFLLSLKTNNQ